jgi:hypothetical protein
MEEEKYIVAQDPCFMLTRPLMIESPASSTQQQDEGCRELLTHIQQVSSQLSEFAREAQCDPSNSENAQQIRQQVTQLSSLMADYVTKVDKPAKKSKKRSSGEKDGPSKRRHKSVQPPQNMYCRSCGTTQTPEWRRGPDGLKSLCNACGLHYAKIIKREILVPSRKTEASLEVMNLRSLLN